MIDMALVDMAPSSILGFVVSVLGISYAALSILLMLYVGIWRLFGRTFNDIPNVLTLDPIAIIRWNIFLYSPSVKRIGDGVLRSIIFALRLVAAPAILGVSVLFILSFLK